MHMRSRSSVIDVMCLLLCCNSVVALPDRCKEHGVTVQAAVSAASMLAMARAQARNHPLPQNMLMQAPINMRSQASTLNPHDADVSHVKGHL